MLPSINWRELFLGISITFWSIAVIAILSFWILWAFSIRTPTHVMRRYLTVSLWTAVPIFGGYFFAPLTDNMSSLKMLPRAAGYIPLFLPVYSFTYIALYSGATLRTKFNPYQDKSDHLFLRLPALPIALTFTLALYVYAGTNLISVTINELALIGVFLLVVLVVGWFIHPYRDATPNVIASPLPDQANAIPIAVSHRVANLEEIARDSQQPSPDLTNGFVSTDQVADTTAATSSVNLASVLPTHPATPALIPPAQGMALKLKRSQKQNAFGSIVYVLDARMDVSSDVRDRISTHRLGSRLVYESEARQKHRANALGHAAGSADAAGSVPLIATPGQAAKGLLKTAWKLGRAGVSAARASLALRITVDSLLAGVHVECKSMEELLEAEQAIREAASNLKAYVEVGETFDGGEEVVEL